MTDQRFTKEDAERVKAYCEKATLGPWIDESPYVSGKVEGGRPNGEVIFFANPNRMSRIENRSLANCAFIASARTDLPAAIAELERCWAELAECRKRIGDLAVNYASECEVLSDASREIARLKRGDFTEEEFQNLCHNFSEQDAKRFKAGCEEYQRKLFGTGIWAK